MSTARFRFTSTLILSVVLVTCLISVVTADESKSVLSDPASIVLNISTDQVVNQPLLQNAQILLLDSNDVLLTEYDLAASPIELIPAAGVLTPNILDDPTLFSGGIVDFLSEGVTYAGGSGWIEIVATNGEVSSLGVSVSFNGYDILNAFDFAGNPISSIYSGLPTTMRVVVQNRGRRVADTTAYIRHYFKSNASGSAKAFFTPQADGAIDTVQFQVENTIITPGEDTLVLELTSKYLIGGTMYPTTDTLEIPVIVYDPAIFSLYPGSFVPEAAYPGIPFDIAFDVLATDFPGPIDSTNLAIHLVEFVGGPSIATLYAGAPVYTAQSDSIVEYDGLSALIDSLDGVDPGRYVVNLDYRLISGGNVFTLTDPYPESLTVLLPSSVVYDAGSFGPTAVSAGAEATFHFDLLFDPLTFPLKVVSDSSTFSIAGDGFATSVNLVFQNDTLTVADYPDGRVTVSAERLIIPGDLIGVDLTVQAAFHFRHPESGNSLSFNTDFDSMLVAVEELPVVQIVDVRIVAPNRPRVNTNQVFQVRVDVANLSTTDLAGMVLKLASDGDSDFDSLLTVDIVLSEDTTEVLFDVTAASEPVTDEVFRAEIVSNEIDILPPIKDVAVLTIETPALLNLYYSVSNGAQDGLLEYGEGFSLVVGLDNLGQAGVTEGTYSLSTNGVDFGITDPTTGMIDADTTLVFFLSAPRFDTSATISLNLEQLPLDVNSGLPATIDSTSFSIDLAVASTVAALQVTPDVNPSNLVSPGMVSQLFTLDLTNRGTSAITEMQVDRMTLSLSRPDGTPVSVRSILEVGNTGFFENGHKVASATTGQDRLVMHFDDFVLCESQSRAVVFSTKFQPDLKGNFALVLDTSFIEVRFLDERVAETPVGIVPSTGDSLLVSTIFVSTGTTLESSFMIEDNPYDPNEGPVAFAYSLNEPGSVEFRIFTLIGEEVYSLELNEGEPGTSAGLHDDIIVWDGRNARGETVLNGVYVAMLRLAETRQEAFIKVAVVKR